MTRPAPTLPTRRDYRVLFDGTVAGRRVAKGDIVRLTEAEARYEAVAPVIGDAAAPAKPAKARA